MQDLDLCKQLLGLTDPWQVEAVEVDQPSNRLDIYIGFGVAGRKGLFGGGGQSLCPRCHTQLPRTGDFEAVTLRHLPVTGLRTYLHVPPAGTVQSDQIDCVCMHDWMASSIKFTEAMHDYIVLTLENAASNQAAAKLAGVSSGEVREVSEATGVVPAGREGEPGLPSAATETSDSHEFAIEATGNVPGASHSGWQRLINGELAIQTDSVALRMLLQRVRNNLEKDPSQQTRLAGAQSLRQFFIKNQQLLKREIEMLTAEEQAFSDRTDTETSASGGLPPESAAVWQQLIAGKLRLDTRVVGLQMMIERVRQSVEQKPTEGNKLAGARILRQFFAKHQSRLANEIAQLTGGPAAPAASQSATESVQAAAGPDTGTQSLPSERDPVWQQLISGDISIKSDVISLKMLLERVRQAVDRSPTEGNRIAAAKILRQYFAKNRSKHSGEISQLLAGASAASAHAAVTADSLPPDDHPNWQRLINGEIALHTDAVSLKMLLERVRQAIANKPTEANRLAGARMLRQYFIKNQHRHGAEIAALAGAESAVQPVTDDDGGELGSAIPSIEHPSWQRLINGELQIMTDAVGLKMMLERIRLSIEHNPSQASRLAGAKILRQYFIKHQSKHRAELEQLRAA